MLNVSLLKSLKLIFFLLFLRNWQPKILWMMIHPLGWQFQLWVFIRLFPFPFPFPFSLFFLSVFFLWCNFYSRERNLDSIDDGTATFDFEGTGKEVEGNWNCPPAVTYSAVIYCLRCMVKNDIPLNQGCLRPITIKIPEKFLFFQNTNKKEPKIPIPTSKIDPMSIRRLCRGWRKCVNFPEGDRCCLERCQRTPFKQKSWPT